MKKAIRMTGKATQPESVIKVWGFLDLLQMLVRRKISRVVLVLLSLDKVGHKFFNGGPILLKILPSWSLGISAPKLLKAKCLKLQFSAVVCWRNFNLFWGFFPLDKFFNLWPTFRQKNLCCNLNSGWNLVIFYQKIDCGSVWAASLHIYLITPPPNMQFVKFCGILPR